MRTPLPLIVLLLLTPGPTAAAQAPLAERVGPTLTEDAKLTGSDADSVAAVGWSVAAAGDLVVAGAFRDDTAGPQTGAAYVFRHTASGWAEEAKLLAADRHTYDSFGAGSAAEVRPDGEWIVVGAPEWPAFGRRGAAYVFRREGGAWVQEARLTAADGETDDYLGESVALAGDLALVGADGDDGFRGAAYVFRRESATGAWAQEAKLTAADGEAMDVFGRSVALAGPLALVGAGGDDDRGDLAGAAYVLRREGDGAGGFRWAQEAKLTAADGERGDGFGFDVSLIDTSSGTLALVGAGGDDDRGDLAGAAYVLRREGDGAGGGRWVEEAKLTAADAELGDAFGNAVALAETPAGLVALIGASYDDGLTGSVYLFRRSPGGTWSEAAKLVASDRDRNGGLFGRSAALSGGWAAVGAPYDDGRGGPGGRGAVYLYDLGRAVASEPATSGSAGLTFRAWPNPFTSRLALALDLPTAGPVRLALHDALGREVAALHDAPLAAGPHVLTLDMPALPPGTYLLRLDVGGARRTARLTRVPG